MQSGIPTNLQQLLRPAFAETRAGKNSIARLKAEPLVLLLHIAPVVKSFGSVVIWPYSLIRVPQVLYTQFRARQNFSILSILDVADLNQLHHFEPEIAYR